MTEDKGFNEFLECLEFSRGHLRKAADKALDTAKLADMNQYTAMSAIAVANMEIALSAMKAWSDDGEDPYEKLKTIFDKVVNCSKEQCDEHLESNQ